MGRPMEHRRRRRPRERRLKAGKMLRWSILSESPSSCAAKACGAWVCERIAKCGTGRFFACKKALERLEKIIKYK